MKTKITIAVSLFFGILIGIIFSGIFISVSSGEMMVKEIKSPYEFDKTVSVLSSRINNKEIGHKQQKYGEQIPTLSNPHIGNKTYSRRSNKDEEGRDEFIW